MKHYFMGVDHREMEAARVCEFSAVSRSFGELKCHHLEHLSLREKGYFDRPWRITEEGQMYDERDGKPFSTQFSHTRFLTPILAKDMGLNGWVLFTDCDWLWQESPLELFKLADPTKTVMVVKHNYNPTVSVKMDGQKQSAYNRKLWSALTLWNLDAPYLPTREMVNHADGGFLHRFEWIPDERIGSLPEEWHWLPGDSPTTEEATGHPVVTKGIHFTLGVPLPSMTNRKATSYDFLWETERDLMSL